MSNQYCTFRLADQLFGVDVLAVQEVIQLHELTLVPRSASVVRGLVNLRGQIVTAFDLRERLGLPEQAEPAGESVGVVLRGEGGAVGLLVDAIGDVLTVDGELEEEPPPTLDERTRELLVKVCKLEDELLLVLDAARTVDLKALS